MFANTNWWWPGKLSVIVSPNFADLECPQIEQLQDHRITTLYI